MGKTEAFFNLSFVPFVSKTFENTLRKRLVNWRVRRGIELARIAGVTVSDEPDGHR